MKCNRHRAMNGIVVLKTKDKDSAGTDLIVEICIDDSDWVTLDNEGDDREKGAIDIYNVRYMPMTVSAMRLRVRHNDKHLNVNEMHDAWYLDWIVARPGYHEGYTTFHHFNDWIKVPRGDDSWHYIDDITVTGQVSNEAFTLLVKQGATLLSYPAADLLKEIGLPDDVAGAVIKLFKPTTF